jgi:hypothetical protein
MAQQFFAAQAAATMAAHPQIFTQKSNDSSDDNADPDTLSPNPSLSPQN